MSRYTVAAGAGAAGGGALGGLFSLQGVGAIRHASADAQTFDGQPTPAYATSADGSLVASLGTCAGPASVRAPGPSPALRGCSRATAAFRPSFCREPNLAANARQRGRQHAGSACDFIAVTDLYLARRIGCGHADAVTGGFSLAGGEAASVAAKVAAPELTATSSASVGRL